MMRGISGAPVPADLLYAAPINIAAGELNFSPILAYAIANRETVRGERNGKWVAADVISFDQGHGLFQLTSWWPDDWRDPKSNTHWAVVRWLQPSFAHYTVHHGYEGDVLITAIADAFNAGQGAVCTLCNKGENPDDATTGKNYGRDVVECYHSLLAHRTPT